MRALALCLTTTALLAAPAFADTFIPEGDADSVLHLADDGSVIGRIRGLENVHGLALAPRSGTLIAGSLSQARREPGSADMAGADADGTSGSMIRPESMSQAEHERHHLGGAATSGAVSVVSLVDADTHEVTRRVEVPGMVHHVAVDAAERHAVVTHPGLGSVSIIDLGTGGVTATMATGPEPEYAVADPETGRFFVSNAGNATISELDPEAGIVTRNIPLEADPKHLQLVPGTRTLVAAEADAGTVSLVDADTGAVTDRFEIGGELHGVQSDGEALYVGARERGRVVAVDLTTGERRETEAVEEPYHLALAPGAVMVSSAGSGAVATLDPETLEVRRTIDAASVAHQIVVAPAP